MNWLKLESLATLNKIISNSNLPKNKAIAIFKHSTHCPVSSAAKSRLELTWKYGDELPIYYLDLIAFREVSNQIASEFNINHQSPQLLVIKNGKCIYHASHISISVKELEKVI
ncbi:MAG: bacillithiol system redox-active protein YtxJ [Flavobacteriales bacterium]|nr:bacillithiol system redox-active protein YtxJ [Flavobacteriales bacterium]MCB9364641.1 bacillithiol system redox-active protein YtxJ [Flavobacteriales bacterium]